MRSARVVGLTVSGLLACLGAAGHVAARAHRAPLGSAGGRVDLVAFRMAAPSVGWALTATRVLRTTDGGRTWDDRSPAGLAAARVQPGLAGGQPANIASFGRSTFWLAVPSRGRVTVFATTDAGKRWQRVVIAPGPLAGLSSTDVPTVLGLAAASGRAAWLLLSAGGIAAGSEDVELYRTTDAGRSWRPAAVSTQGKPSPGGLPAAGVKTGLGFATPRRGWLAGYEGQRPGVRLYETRDGGRTWRAATLPPPGGVAATHDHPLTFAPAFSQAEGVLPSLWPRRKETVFYTTRDRGSHWRPVAPLASPGGNAVAAWSWSGAARIVAVSGSRLCRTAAGRSWSCKPEPSALRGIAALQFASARLGWALVRGRLLETTDGGATWARP